MRGAARIAWLYCTLFPVQRWLGGIALGLLVLVGTIVGLTVQRSGGALIGALAVSMLLPLSLFFVPAALAAGFVFRLLSAPRSHRLLPAFRGRLLASVILLTLGISGLACLVLWLLGVQLPAATDGPNVLPPHWPLPFLFVPTFVSAALYCGFRLSSGSRWILVDAVVAVLIGYGVADLIDRIDTLPWVPWLLLAGLLAAWITFAIWYLRIPAIAPVDLAGLNRSPLGARHQAAIGPATADEIVLTGRRPLRLRSALPGAIVGGVILALLPVLLLDSDRFTSRPNSFESTLAIIIALSTAGALNQIGSRARLLWLLVGRSRRTVFHLVERAALKLLSTLFVALASFAVTFGMLVSLGPQRIITTLLLVVGLALLTTYIVLGRARNIGAREIGLCIAAALSTVVIYAGYRAGAWPYPILVALIATQIAIAAALRNRAQRNWERVDWLEYRVVRTAALAGGLLAGAKRRS